MLAHKMCGIPYSVHPSTALNHLDSGHGINPDNCSEDSLRARIKEGFDSDVFLSRCNLTRKLDDAGVIRFMRTMCKRGAMNYARFDDPDFQAGLSFATNAKNAKACVVREARNSLKEGCLVSLVSDLETVDKIHTLNTLAVSPHLGKAYMISSARVTDASAQTISQLLLGAIARIEFFAPKCVIGCIVTDAGANMLAAVRLLQGASKHPILGHHCACHVINLVCKDVDVELQIIYQFGPLLSELQEAGHIHRVPPTRWWALSEEMEAALARASTVSALELAQLAKLVNYLVNSADAVVRHAALNRYMEVYARSEISALMALLSPVDFEPLEKIGRRNELINALKSSSRMTPKRLEPP